MPVPCTPRRMESAGIVLPSQSQTSTHSPPRNEQKTPKPPYTSGPAAMQNDKQRPPQAGTLSEQYTRKPTLCSTRKAAANPVYEITPSGIHNCPPGTAWKHHAQVEVPGWHCSDRYFYFTTSALKYCMIDWYFSVFQIFHFFLMQLDLNLAPEFSLSLCIPGLCHYAVFWAYAPIPSFNAPPNFSTEIGQGTDRSLVHSSVWLFIDMECYWNLKRHCMSVQQQWLNWSELCKYTCQTSKFAISVWPKLLHQEQQLSIIPFKRQWPLCLVIADCSWTRNLLRGNCCLVPLSLQCWVHNWCSTVHLVQHRSESGQKIY